MGEISYRGRELCVEDVPVSRIIERIGTPAYIYSSKTILKRYDAFHSAFGGTRLLICYAMKANPSRGVCRLLAVKGAGADVVSGGELLRAVAAGFKPRNIVFSGVGKTAEEMRLALRSGVRALNVESGEELAALEDVSRRLRRRASVVIRVNPDVDAGTHAHITTGKAANKFGVEEGEALELYRKAAASRWLKPVGIQCHIGSQITRLAPYRAALRSLTRVLARLREAGIALAHADVGGGMGIDYGDGAAFSPGAFAAAVKRELRAFPELEILAEPGRYLVGEAGILVGKVLYRKKADGRRLVIVDAAMTDLIRPALYGARHGIVPVAQRSAAAGKVDVVGPVCETADTFAERLPLGIVQPGDLLAILQAGAYGFAMSSQYNSRPRAPEALVSGASWRVIRRRETVKDLIRHER